MQGDVNILHTGRMIISFLIPLPMDQDAIWFTVQHIAMTRMLYSTAAMLLPVWSVQSGT